MQTNFSEEQLRDPDTAHSETILRRCVHCGFCTATCPTYLLLGDELDSPRGRIYLIKEMLEEGAPPTKEVVTHIDRCLSCLSCMTTCPSGVNYMHLIDHARSHIEKTYERPAGDRLFRELLARALPNAFVFRWSVRLAAWTRPLHGLLPKSLRTLTDAAPKRPPRRSEFDKPQVWPAEGARRMRVALLAGCVQRTLAPEINAATIRLLTRLGVEVVVAKEAGCCGALQHHLGREESAKAAARRNIDAWMKAARQEPVDAVVVNASGCGTMLKDYAHLLREDPAYAEKAQEISSLSKDIVEILEMLEPSFDPPAAAQRVKVAYHSACSMQHGQSIKQAPRKLLEAAGFEVAEPAEGHICCGSAGSYSFLQPEIAGRLRTRKADNLNRLDTDVIAAGNIGCITHLAPALGPDILHTVQLLDWAAGGPDPRTH